jgi:hypothetical protein
MISSASGEGGGARRMQAAEWKGTAKSEWMD